MMSEQSYLSDQSEPEPIANVDAEAALLGALLTKNDLFDLVIEHISAGDFYEPLHSRIFSAIQDQLAIGRGATPITLRPMFADDPAMKDLGGPAYLSTITGSGAALVGARDFARQIADLARTRDLYDQTSEILAQIRDTRSGINPAKHAAALEAVAFSATSTKSDRNTVFSMADSIDRARQRVVDVQTSGDPTGAVAVDLPELTAGIGPVERGHLIILAGRPGMGKTALLCAAARSMGMGDLTIAPEDRKVFGVGVVSLEMSDVDLGNRFAADVALALGEEVPHAAIRDATLNDRQLRILKWAADQVRLAPVKLLDTSSLTMSRLANHGRRMKRELEAEGHNLDVLFIDYLQLLNGDGKFDNKVQEITAISQGLKRLAKELDCAVIALSQLSRQVEQRDLKIPQLSDLRESGSIEQDADTIGFLYRENYYLQNQEPDRETKAQQWEAWDLAMRATRNQVDLIVAKRRAGANSRKSMTWLPEFSAIRAKAYFSANAGALYQ